MSGLHDGGTGGNSSIRNDDQGGRPPDLGARQARVLRSSSWLLDHAHHMKTGGRDRCI